MALALASCEREVARRAAGDDCLFNGDCADPLVCAARRCRAPCRDDRDCVNGSLCRPAVRTTCAKPPCAPPRRRVCVEPGGPAICFSDGDCEAEQLCAPDGQCRYRCAPGFDIDCQSRYGAGARCEAMGSAAVCMVPAATSDASVGVDATAPDVAPQTDGPAPDRASGVDASDGGARDADGGDAATVTFRCAVVQRPGACAPGAPGCDVTKVAHGGKTACALLSDGELRCWGLAEQMQFGPAGACHIPGLSHRGPWRDVALGSDHLCAIDAAAQVRCAGWNIVGQCGTGVMSPQVVAPSVVVKSDGAPLTDARSLAAGATHTCAIVGADGRVACWGSGANGELGPGLPPRVRPSAADVPGVTGAVGLTLHDGLSCAWRADGASWCWGAWARRADGTPAMALDATPHLTTFPPVRGMAANTLVLCALLRDGTVQCVGSNLYGARADGAPLTPSNTVASPRPVLGLTDVEQLVAGAMAMCARRRSGEVVCWGGWPPDLTGAVGFVAHATPTAFPFPMGVREVFMGGQSGGWSGGRFGLCASYGGADLRCLGIIPGEGSNSVVWPVRVNWTGAGL